MARVIIIGGGMGGSALLPILLENKEVEIVGVVDRDRNAPAMKMAEKIGIPAIADLKDAVAKLNFDVVIDVTRSDEVSDFLRKNLPSHIEVLGGACSKLLWELVTERRSMAEELEMRLKEHEALYKIGIELAAAERSQKVFDIILTSAIELSGIPAGSIAILDEKSSMLKMVLAKGFSQNFISLSSVWALRRNGFTASVLNSTTPIIIPDITKMNVKDVNPLLLEEGIKSLIATPLRIHNRTLGILYLDDYKPREFKHREIAILNLLATQATLAIDKMHLLERAEYLAITDELTQLYNHRYFSNALSNEVYRARRYGHPLSLIMMDIDNFKKYNDAYGHPLGNFILSFMAEIFKKNIRNTDTVARYGGEEFVIVSPENDKEEALILAERIRKDVERLCRPEINEGIAAPVTISLGVASFPDDAKDEEGLIKKADETLYKAKRDGKNRVCCP
ncbi:MAG: diguanylate cyclase [Deltaproteobacteria bacterium]|nr:diguanylate cyclase [Deltaproteobacteria bacterium]